MDSTSGVARFQMMPGYSMGTLCFRELLHEVVKQLGGLGACPPGNFL